MWLVTYGQNNSIEWKTDRNHLSIDGDIELKYQTEDIQSCQEVKINREDLNLNKNYAGSHSVQPTPTHFPELSVTLTFDLNLLWGFPKHHVYQIWSP